MVSKQQKELKKKIWNSFFIEIPLTGVTANYENNMLTIKGPKGENVKRFKYPNVVIKNEQDKILIGTERFSKTEKKIIFTYKAHINNMIKGVLEGFEYNLIIVYAKFPMTVGMSGNIFNVKNLLGEKVPRTIKIKEGANVVIKGKNITVTGIDKEIVGQTAANIEQLCRVTNLDRRVVQDGIFITKKPHKSYV